MEVNVIAIVAAVVLFALAGIALLGFAVRNLTFGKHNPVSIILGALPILLLLIFGLAGMEWADAGVLAAVIAFALACLGLLFSSARGLIGM
jgi:hypothetical protein